MTTAIATTLSPNPASGTTTTDGTEQTLASTTSLSAGGIMELQIETHLMADGDAIELRVYLGVNAADRLAHYASFVNTQTDVCKRSIPVAVPTSGRYKATIKRTAGTDRAYDWQVVQL